MLFLIKHSCTFFKEKAVYAVMPCLLFYVVVYAAACHNYNICALAYIEIVIHKVVNIAVRYARWDIYRFSDGKGLNLYIYTRLVGL